VKLKSLELAGAYGNLEIVKLLLSDLSCSDTSMIDMAQKLNPLIVDCARNGDYECLSSLLALPGVDVNIQHSGINTHINLIANILTLS